MIKHSAHSVLNIFCYKVIITVCKRQDIWICTVTQRIKVINIDCFKFTGKVFFSIILCYAAVNIAAYKPNEYRTANHNHALHIAEFRCKNVNDIKNDYHKHHYHKYWNHNTIFGQTENFNIEFHFCHSSYKKQGWKKNNKYGRCFYRQWYFTLSVFLWQHTCKRYDNKINNTDCKHLKKTASCILAFGKLISIRKKTGKRWKEISKLRKKINQIGNWNYTQKGCNQRGWNNTIIIPLLNLSYTESFIFHNKIRNHISCHRCCCKKLSNIYADIFKGFRQQSAESSITACKKRNNHNQYRYRNSNTQDYTFYILAFWIGGCNRSADVDIMLRAEKYTLKHID